MDDDLQRALQLSQEAGVQQTISKAFSLPTVIGGHEDPQGRGFCFADNSDYTFVLPSPSGVPCWDRVKQEILDDELDWSGIGGLDELGMIQMGGECSVMVPLRTRGDGNCLLHGCSLAMVGGHDHTAALRSALASTMTGLSEVSERFFDRWKTEIRRHDVGRSDAALDEEWETQVLPILTRNAATEVCSVYDASLEPIHVFVLAHVLRRPILVYNALTPGSWAAAQPVTAGFEGVFLPLLLDASEMVSRTPLCLGYTTGHFTALVYLNETKAAPLHNSSGEPLQVRFMPEDNTLDISQWIDVQEDPPRAALALPLKTHDDSQMMLSSYLANAEARAEAATASGEVPRMLRRLSGAFEDMAGVGASDIEAVLLLSRVDESVRQGALLEDQAAQLRTMIDVGQSPTEVEDWYVTFLALR